MIGCRTYEPVVKTPALHVLMFEIDPENAAWYSFNARAFFDQYIRFPVPSVSHTLLVILCSAPLTDIDIATALTYSSANFY
jgi:hypothetical protein